MKIKVFRVNGAKILMMEFQTEGWTKRKIFEDTGKLKAPSSRRILWTTADTIKVLLAPTIVLHLVFRAEAGIIT